MSKDQLSTTIRIARVICLLGIVYVHAWTGLGGAELARLNDTPQGLMRWGLIEFLGRGAVPLLSIISGWLVVGSLEKRPWASFMAGKARTILVPMVLWNGLAILLVSSAAFAGLIRAPVPTTWWWTLDELLCLATPNDINVQMSFLRDLFICMVFAPLLIRLPTWGLSAIAAATLAWIVGGYSTLLLLRVPILFFFLIGIMARRTNAAAKLASQPIALAALPYLGICAVKIWLGTAGIDAGTNGPILQASIDMVMRIISALFFWTIASRLTTTRLAGLLLRLEPYAFLMFCSHLIMIWLAGPMIGLATGPMGSPGYPFFLLLHPLFVLITTIGLGRALVRLSPGIARMLSGERLGKGPHPKAQPQETSNRVPRTT